MVGIILLIIVGFFPILVFDKDKIMRQKKLNFSIFEAQLFCLLYDYKKPTEVASILGITPSLVNVTISRLEKKLNSEKFFIKEKKHGDYIPTNAAELIIDSMRYIVQFGHEVEAKNNYTNKHIFISSTHSILHYYLLPYIPEFIENNPDTYIGFKQNDDLSFKTQSINEIIITCFVDDRKNKQYFPYHSFQQKLWASPEYINKYGNPSNVDELRKHRLLMRKNVDDPRILFGSSHISSQINDDGEIHYHDIYSASLIDSLCLKGCGIMAGAEETVKIGNFRFQNVFESFQGDKVDLYVAVHKEFLNRKTCKKLVNWIFESRNKLFRQIGVKPTYPFTPIS